MSREEGEVLIEGENAIKNKALFDKVAYVPQEIDLFNYMSVAENLFMPYEKSGIKGTVNQKELEEQAILSWRNSPSPSGPMSWLRISLYLHSSFCRSPGRPCMRIMTY